MSDRFVSETVFAYYPEFQKGDSDRFEQYGTRILSTIPDLQEKCDAMADIFNPLITEENIGEELREGIYLAYIQGDVYWEHNINHEFGTDDGDWVFVPDEGYPRFTPLSVKPEDIKHVKHGRAGSTGGSA